MVFLRRNRKEVNKNDELDGMLPGERLTIEEKRESRRSWGSPKMLRNSMIH